MSEAARLSSTSINQIPPIRLSICIPTHHGRVDTLRELLESIVRQNLADWSQFEICVSDNASNDGTADLVEAIQRHSPVTIRYFRFGTDHRGVRNFVNAVEMARGEYCWLVGSDDLLLEGALLTVVQALRDCKVDGATVNKLNLDHGLERFLGPDAAIIVPAKPRETRALQGFERIAHDLGLLFTYMSTHIFRREAWLSIVEEVGIDRLVDTRHFPHTFVFCRIAERAEVWLWIGDYCVAQRLGNYCLLEEKGHRESLYAMEVLEDLEKVWLAVLRRDSKAYGSLMRRHFLLYWNPFCVRKFLCEPGMTRKEALSMRTLAVRCFGGSLVFWITSYLILWAPRGLLRATKRFTSLPEGSAGSGHRSGSLRRVLGAIGIRNRWTSEFDFAAGLADRAITRRREWLERPAPVHQGSPNGSR